MRDDGNGGMARAAVLAVVAVLACGKSPSKDQPLDDKPLEAMPRYPECKQRASVVAIPPAPLGKMAGGSDLVGRSLVASDRGKHPMRLAMFDLATATWDELPSVDLVDEADIAPSTNATAERVLVGYEKTGGYAMRVLDRAKRTWSEPKLPAGWTHAFVHTVGTALVVVPYRPCGWQELGSAHRLAGDQLVAMPAPIGPRVNPVDEVVGGRWVVFGGQTYDAAPTGDVGCGSASDHGKPLGDGAVFDPAANQWTALPAGPPARRDYSSRTAGNSLFVWNDEDRVVWQYDVVANTWRRLAELPEAFLAHHGGDAFHERTTGAGFGDRFAMLHLSNRKGLALVIDTRSGTIAERAAPPLDIANHVAVDADHWLVLPRGLSRYSRKPDPMTRAPLPVGYLYDVTADTWCELPWSVPHPFSYTWLEPAGDAIVAWSPDGAPAGAVITIR